MRVRLVSLSLCASLCMAATAPALTYSTYLRDRFTPNAIAMDSSGNIYIAGAVVVDPAIAQQTTALVMKLNPKGTQVLYTRYIGGSTSDSANAIAVDLAGNAYIAGQTGSSDFPVTAGGNLGTKPASVSDQRSFVTKLDPNGNIIFSDLLGGSTYSLAQAIAVTPAGQAIVSGLTNSSGFPTTTGAYTVADSKNRPYLLEVDPTGAKLIFSSTGIGGSALALDSSGNIFIAGSTTLLDYPTTPGAYQTKFLSVVFCTSPCGAAIPGSNQYISKVDPSGSHLLYSTALSGTRTSTNAGLAVDQAGNAYVTGFAGPGYPYTVTPPDIPTLSLESGRISGLPFVSKLDPTGQTLLFSVPVGGAGVQVDFAGAVYAGGRVGRGPQPIFSYSVTASLPVLANVPLACYSSPLMFTNSAYVSQLDAASGNVLGTQFIGGSNLLPSAVALSGSTLWIAGPTGGPDVPMTPNVLAPDFGFPNPGANLAAGAYLGAVDFSQPALPAAPQIGCVLDAADFSPASTVQRYQLMSIVGSRLGPATGVSATDNKTLSLAGVSVTFDSLPAPLLYVSSTQINFAVPLVRFAQISSVMKVTVNNTDSAPRQFFLNYGGNSHLFMNMGTSVPIALNADGSLNSSANPAKQGSVVSVFVNGLAQDPDVNNAPLMVFTASAWTVTNVAPISPFVVRVDLRAPVFPTGGCALGICSSNIALYAGGAPLNSSTNQAILYFK